ncbi:hypothetical protein GCM10009626_38250 [Brachybacterium sacelli]
MKTIVPITKAMMIAAELKKIAGEVRRRKASCNRVSMVATPRRRALAVGPRIDPGDESRLVSSFVQGVSHVTSP